MPGATSGRPRRERPRSPEVGSGRAAGPTRDGVASRAASSPGLARAADVQRFTSRAGVVSPECAVPGNERAQGRSTLRPVGLLRSLTASPTAARVGCTPPGVSLPGSPTIAATRSIRPTSRRLEGTQAQPEPRRPAGRSPSWTTCSIVTSPRPLLGRIGRARFCLAAGPSCSSGRLPTTSYPYGDRSNPRRWRLFHCFGVG